MTYQNKVSSKVSLLQNPGEIRAIESTKRATNYKALLRKMTYQNKASSKVSSLQNPSEIRAIELTFEKF